MHIKGSNRINLEALLKVVILLGFSLFFFTVIQSGKVQLYVHPRIVPYMEFGMVAMTSIAFFTLRDVFKPKRNVNLLPYLFFIIPLFAAFTLPAKSMDSTSMAFGSIRIAQQTQPANPDTAVSSNPDTNTFQDNPGTPAPDNAASSSAPAGQADPEKMDSGLKLQGDTIVMEDNNFVKWLQEIYDKMDVYQGKKIEVKGFVFKDKQFKENEFVPARLMMACCSADLQPIGFLCRYEEAPSLKPDTWIKVTGTIAIIDYQGEKTPIIAADSVIPADKPKNEYVYPY